VPTKQNISNPVEEFFDLAIQIIYSQSDALLQWLRLSRQNIKIKREKNNDFSNEIVKIHTSTAV